MASYESSATKRPPRKRRRLAWHRRDLRLHDNELYSNLLNENTRRQGDESSPKASSTIHDDEPAFECISLYVFDTKYFHPQPSLSCPKEYDTVWCGPHAAFATIEAVTALRAKLQAIGGDLLVRVGDPTVLIPNVVEELEVDEIVFGEEPGTYERFVAQKLQQHYHSKIHKDWGYNISDSMTLSPSFYPHVQVKSVIGYTLYHPDDLPKDPHQWSKLAHPRQQFSKKKQHRQKETGKQSLNHSPTDENLVDVSPERFQGICRIMGDFRKAARGFAKVRPLLKTPAKLVLPFTATNIEIGNIPTLKELMEPLLSPTERPILGMTKNVLTSVMDRLISTRVMPNDKLSSEPATDVPSWNMAQNCRPARTEDAALQRLEEFVSSGQAAVADRSRADVVTNNHSSRLSVHLALGTLSPRATYWKVHENIQKQNAKEGGCQWLGSHLEIRDFFLYTAFANDRTIFSSNGLPRSSKQKRHPKGKKGNLANKKDKSSILDENKRLSSETIWKSPATHENVWTRWATGKTQFPLIDAAMRELMATGYCSSRVRQNAASFLTKDLRMDWRAGAEWFQFWLEDHCVGANYGNWLYFSGVGPDPRNRHFCSISQMKKYDHFPDSPPGSYVLKWVPELRVGVSSDNHPEALFRPWDFNVAGFEEPIVDPKSQYTWQDSQLLAETGKLLEE